MENPTTTASEEKESSLLEVLCKAQCKGGENLISSKHSLTMLDVLTRSTLQRLSWMLGTYL